MEYYEYYLVFPDGDKQPVEHSLEMGTIVDMNGIPYQKDYKLHPNKIAYKVAGIKKQIHFKDVTVFYKLDLMTKLDVEDEIEFRHIQEIKYKNKLDRRFSQLEKKAQKRKNKKGFWFL